MLYRDNRKTSFVLFYASTEQLIDNFNDEEVGKAFRAIARYEMYGEIPPDEYFDDRALKMVYLTIQSEIDRKFDNWLETCERNKRNRNKYKYTDEADQIDGDEP